MKWAVANWQTLGERSDDRAFNSGRYRWKDFRDERAMVGDGVHQFIEMENTDGWDYPELDEEQQRIIGQWNIFKSEREIKPLLSEFTVYNRAVGYMGTVDGLWEIDGVTCWVDVKTSRNTWPEHYCQLSAS